MINLEELKQNLEDVSFPKCLISEEHQRLQLNEICIGENCKSHLIPICSICRYQSHLEVGHSVLPLKRLFNVVIEQLIQSLQQIPNSKFIVQINQLGESILIAINEIQAMIQKFLLFFQNFLNELRDRRTFEQKQVTKIIEQIIKENNDKKLRENITQIQQFINIQDGQIKFQDKLKDQKEVEKQDEASVEFLQQIYEYVKANNLVSFLGHLLDKQQLPSQSEEEQKDKKKEKVPQQNKKEVDYLEKDQQGILMQQQVLDMFHQILTKLEKGSVQSEQAVNAKKNSKESVDLQSQQQNKNSLQLQNNQENEEQKSQYQLKEIISNASQMNQVSDEKGQNISQSQQQKLIYQSNIVYEQNNNFNNEEKQVNEQQYNQEIQEDINNNEEANNLIKQSQISLVSQQDNKLISQIDAFQDSNEKPHSELDHQDNTQMSQLGIQSSYINQQNAQLNKQYNQYQEILEEDDGEVPQQFKNLVQDFSKLQQYNNNQVDDFLGQQEDHDTKQQNLIQSEIQYQNQQFTDQQNLQSNEFK